MSGRRPTLSVLLPVRDGGALLSEALDSILGQEGPTFEVIAVDDGSTDDSAARLAAAAASDRRVQILTTPPCGVAAALNAGLARCRAEVIVRQDHDDVSEPGRFAAVAARFDREPDLLAVDTDVILLEGHRTAAGMRRWIRWHEALADDDGAIRRERFVDCPLTAMSFRRAAVEAVGGYHELDWNEDHDLFCRLAELEGRFGRIPRPLYGLRDRPDRLSRTAPHATQDRLRALKAHFLARGPLRRERLGGRPVVIWGAGRNGKRTALALREEGLVVEAFVELDPRKVGQSIHGAAVIWPRDLPPAGEVFTLIAVGQPGARESIRRRLREAGHADGRDFLAVA